MLLMGMGVGGWGGLGAHPAGLHGTARQYSSTHHLTAPPPHHTTTPPAPPRSTPPHPAPLHTATTQPPPLPHTSLRSYFRCRLSWSPAGGVSADAYVTSAGLPAYAAGGGSPSGRLRFASELLLTALIVGRVAVVGMNLARRRAAGGGALSIRVIRVVSLGAGCGHPSHCGVQLWLCTCWQQHADCRSEGLARV